MSDDRPSKQPESNVAETMRVLDELAATRTYDLFRTSGGATLAAGVRAALEMLSSTAGECRLAEPYSPLRPVLGADGALRWCCSHQPEHCV